jgi:hypothetical protein
MDDWAKQRLAELHAAVPIKRKRAEPFARISLSWAAMAAAATNCPRALVWIWLVYRAWQTKSTTVSVPNSALVKLGVSREVKRLALRQLERAGLVTIERHTRKTPAVTLLKLSKIMDSTVNDC